MKFSHNWSSSSADFWWENQVIILHRSYIISCHTMCKTVTSFDHFFSCNSHTYMMRFWTHELLKYRTRAAAKVAIGADRALGLTGQPVRIRMHHWKLMPRLSGGLGLWCGALGLGWGLGRGLGVGVGAGVGGGGWGWGWRLGWGIGVGDGGWGWGLGLGVEGYQHGWNLIPAWIRIYTYYIMKLPMYSEIPTMQPSKFGNR